MIERGTWLRKLAEAEAALPFLLRDEHAAQWRTLLIDYDPPRVERLFLDVGENRICLHRIHPCETALFHPHPWPSAVRILDGGYEMGVGYGPGGTPPPLAATLVLAPESTYEMIHPDGWHYVRPTLFQTYSVMISGKPWGRLSPGKGIVHKTLSDEDSSDLLNTFRLLYP